MNYKIILLVMGIISMSSGYVVAAYYNMGIGVVLLIAGIAAITAGCAE